MPSKAEKLLEQMRENKSGWKRHDLETLYEGFGFIIKSSRGPHDKVFHPKYPMLVTSLPRHTKLAHYLVKQAIDLIDKLIALEKSKGEDNG